jgi:hypothetical protein
VTVYKISPFIGLLVIFNSEKYSSETKKVLEKSMVLFVILEIVINGIPFSAFGGGL